MPLVRHIERTIESLEGFRVKIVTETGADVRSDRQLAKGFNGYVRRMADSATVEEWKASRFRPAFVGLDVQVLHGDSTPAHGRTLLRTVRASYS